MPLDYRIDQERRLVITAATGTLTDEELFAYQREVWSRSDLTGYDEVVDLGQVEGFVQASGDRVRALAELSSAMDVSGASSKVAIVAPQDLAYGFARMFETYRTMNQGGPKIVSVFRSMRAALEWLGLEGSGRRPVEDPTGPGASS